MKSYRAIARLTVTGILCVPVAALADNNRVTIYGKLYPQINSVKTTGATPIGTPLSTLSSPATGVTLAHIMELEAADSWFGFRGSEDLGNGLKAFWQIEQNVSIDTGRASFGGRNTHVGLSSAFGAVRIGKIDTVYKNTGDTLSFLGVGPKNFVSHNNVISKAGFGSHISSSFHLRRENSLHYATRTFNGVQLMGQYSPDEAKTGTRNASLSSYGIKYSSRNLYLGLAHEIHNDFFGGSRNAPAALSNFANQNARSKDRATRATIKYSFGRTTVEFDYALKKYKETGGVAGRFESYKNNAWLLAVQQKYDAHTFMTSYVRADAGRCSLVGTATCSTDGLEGQQFNFGMSYNLSQRTYGYVLGTLLKNGKSAMFNNMANNRPAPGADIIQIGVGLSHSF